MKVTVPVIAPRAHRMLFQANSPFKPKVVQRKDLYQRRPKHRDRGEA